MHKKKIIGFSIFALLMALAIFDAIRYLKPDVENKKVIHVAGYFKANSAQEMILVYNAWGGIYPGVVDFVHKEFFPKTYPCNLCYQTFGTFSMKDEWRIFLKNFPGQITELHKDNFKRLYKPGDMQLPAILIGNGKDVQVLFSATELNQFTSLQEIIAAVKEKLAV